MKAIDRFGLFILVDSICISYKSIPCVYMFNSELRLNNFFSSGYGDHMIMVDDV